MSHTIEYLKVLRLDHWLKNVFILFGHGVAFVLLGLTLDVGLMVMVVLSLIPACLVASANYILNEILDAPFDRLHPTKKHRAVAAGTVSIPILWIIMVLLLVVAFVFSALVFNLGYLISLGLLFLSGLVYNIPPVRLKDRAFLDVIAESFNNPIRLWLGWYALAPATTFPPLSIVMAWWFFGALLMAGKRYAEFRFINDPERSGLYRKSFKVYRNRTLIISMITYANLFCFCMGVAIAIYQPNMLFVFPVVVVAIIVYFNHAMTEQSARLEPEQLLKNPWIILCTILTMVAAVVLLYIPYDLTEYFHFLRLLDGK